MSRQIDSIMIDGRKYVPLHNDDRVVIDGVTYVPENRGSYLIDNDGDRWERLSNGDWHCTTTILYDRSRQEVVDRYGCKEEG